MPTLSQTLLFVGLPEPHVCSRPMCQCKCTEYEYQIISPFTMTQKDTTHPEPMHFLINVHILVKPVIWVLKKTSMACQACHFHLYIHFSMLIYSTHYCCNCCNELQFLFMFRGNSPCSKTGFLDFL